MKWIEQAAVPIEWKGLLSEADRNWVIAQLDRSLSRPATVAARDTNGKPLVLLNAPYVPAKAPFPTLFWLCNKTQHARIGHIEQIGGVKQAEHWLAANDLLVEWAAEHQVYAQYRWACVPADWRAELDDGRMQVLSQSGIGGIRAFQGVKCLHLATAWQLARQHAGLADSVLAQFLREQGLLVG